MRCQASRTPWHFHFRGHVCIYLLTHAPLISIYFEGWYFYMMFLIQVSCPVRGSLWTLRKQVPFTLQINFSPFQTSSQTHKQALLWVIFHRSAWVLFCSAALLLGIIEGCWSGVCNSRFISANAQTDAHVSMLSINWTVSLTRQPGTQRKSVNDVCNGASRAHSHGKHRGRESLR